MKSKFKMHQILRDKVTGFTGCVLAISFYATGCTHYGLCPRQEKKDGGIPEWEWLDESRLTPVAASSSGKSKTKRGGPSCNPPQA